MEKLLTKFMERMEQRFDRLSNDIDEIKVGINRLEGRMDKIEGRMDNLEGRMDKIEGRMDNLEGRMDKLDNKVDILENNQKEFALSLKQNATEFRSYFGKIETDLTQIRDSIKIYASELHHVKTDVEFLSGKTGVHDTKINNIEKRLEA